MINNPNKRNIFAVDPGEVYCGFAWVRLYRAAPHQCDCPFGCSSDGAVRIRHCVTFSPPLELFNYLEANLRHAGVLVIEEFRLYPWMARQQGFSTFGTSETIGVCKWLARRAQVPVVMQPTAKTLKDGRRRADEWGFPMIPAVIGSGRYAEPCPDFGQLRGKPHRRDAAAHAIEYIGSTGLYPYAA